MIPRKIFLAALFAALLPATLNAQRTPARPAQSQGGINITAADMVLVVEGLGFPPQTRAQLAQSADERKSFARDIRQMLATAEEARAAGLGERPELKLQMGLARSFVIAQAYFKRRQEAGATGPGQLVSKAEMDAFLKEPGRDAEFELFVADYQKHGPTKGAALSAEQRAQLQQHWVRVMVGERKGVAEGIDRERKTQLVVMLQQSRLLAGEYAKQLRPRFQATDAEVDEYIASHPELDTKEARAKAEQVLQRVRAGEDFTALAKEFSADPGSKEKGGDLGWFGRGVMVKPFEDAAFALKPGEVSGVFESPFGFHIVKTDERRTQPGEGGKPPVEEVKARHILIRYGTPATPGAPPRSPREQARAAVEREKEDKVLDEMVARRRVQVAEDYEISATVEAAPPPGAPAPAAAVVGGGPEKVQSAPSSAGQAPKAATRKTPARSKRKGKRP